MFLFSKAPEALIHLLDCPRKWDMLEFVKCSWKTSASRFIVSKVSLCKN